MACLACCAYHDVPVNLGVVFRVRICLGLVAEPTRWPHCETGFWNHRRWPRRLSKATTGAGASGWPHEDGCPVGNALLSGAREAVRRPKSSIFCACRSESSATPLACGHEPSFLCSLGACGRSALSNRSKCLTQAAPQVLRQHNYGRKLVGRTGRQCWKRVVSF